MLGLTPAIGRLIGLQDDALGSGSAAVAVLSWASWTNRFHADPSVIGKRLVIDGAPSPVLRVAPRRRFRPRTAGARRGAAARDDGARRARRRAAPPGAAGVDRIAAARRGRLPARHRARLLRR